MRKNGIKASALCIGTLMCLSTTSGAILAADTANDTAVAGMAVALGNYYSTSDSPEEEILSYLQTETKAVAETTAEKTTQAETTTAAVATIKTSKSTLISAGQKAIDTGLVSVLGSLNIRESAKSDAKVVGYLYNNSQVQIYGSETDSEGNKWLLVQSDGVQGYVNASYVLTGDKAEEAESNITNKNATVIADTLKVRDTASKDGAVVTEVHKDEVFPIMEIKGDFVKIKINDETYGYVHKDYVEIGTEYTHALEIDDQYLADVLEGYRMEIDYSINAYEERLSVQSYSNALTALEYAIYMCDSYIASATDNGLTEAAAKVSKENEEYKVLYTELQNKINNIMEQGGVQEDASVSADSEETDISWIEAYYTGSQKTEGEVLSASEIAVDVHYADGTSKVVTDGWSCSDIGFILPAGYKDVFVTYDGFTSGFTLEVAALESQTAWANAWSTEATEAWAVPATEAWTAPATEAWTAPATEAWTAPVTEAWTAPVTEAWTAPVTEAWTAPVTEAPTEAWTAPVTEAPTPAPTEAWTEPPTTAAPVTEAPTPAPTTAAPVTEAPTPAPVDSASLRNQIVSYALSWVGRCNYVWGGTNLTVGGGVDCSGFTLRVYQDVAGVGLTHYSAAQISQGTQISYDQLRPGDLVFYSNGSSINHVAIYIGNGSIVHAASAQVGIITSSVNFKQPVGFCSILP